MKAIRSTASRGRRQAQQGHALTIVCLMGVLLMCFLSMCFLRTHDAVRLEALSNCRLLRTTLLSPALASGVALLRTGLPPADPYECVLVPNEEEPSTGSVVHFESGAVAGTWEVMARVASASDLANLPAMPAFFGGS